MVGVEGTYTTTGNRIVFTDVKGDKACVQEGPGTYTWASGKDSLTFTMVTDTCPGRNLVLTAQPFTKK